MRTAEGARCGGFTSLCLVRPIRSGIPCSGTPRHAATAAVRPTSGGGGGGSDSGGGGSGGRGGKVGWGGLLLELQATPARDALDAV